MQLDEEELELLVLDSAAKPPPGVEQHTVTGDLPASAKVLHSVPTSTWTYGCTATAAGMLFGYYDRTGYPNMYAGPTNGGLAPLTDLGQGDDPANPIPGSCSLIATQKGFDGLTTEGHVDDYWIATGSPGPDPWVGARTDRVWSSCTADFLGTNQWNWDFDGNGIREANLDGSTTLIAYDTGTRLINYKPSASWGTPQTDACYGMRLFAESRGYTVITNYSQATDSYTGTIKGFSFANYQAQIDAGRPVLLFTSDHTMLGVGYEASTQTVYLHDCWNNSLQFMTWGESYAGMALEHVVVIELASPPTSDDYGDAPAGYPTTLTENGARHTIDSLVFLGSCIDRESNGAHSANAQGDDIRGATDDEDGVTFGTLTAGQTSSLVVQASQMGKLDAWIDFNGDGDWDDTGEQIFVSRELSAGMNPLSITVPAGAITSRATFARFRFSTLGGLSPFGPAANGEVEDYQVAIQAPLDHLTINANSPGGNGMNNRTADEFRLVRNGDNLEAYIDGHLSCSVPFAALQTVTVEGSGDNDTLIVDLAGGMPIPAAGLVFHGDEQTTGDSLIVEHGHVTTLTGSFLTAHDGLLVLDGAAITYTGLEPVRINVDSLSDALFHLPAASGDMVALEDDDTSDNGLSRLRSLSASPTFATTTFTNPAHALTLNAAGGDTLRLTSLDRLFPATTTVTLLGDEHLDRLDIEDKDALARNLTFAYATPTSDSLAIGGYAFPIRLTSIDVVQYTGDATNDDRVTVQTTAAADAITVTPTGQNAADVLLNGGRAAGQPGPDLRFAGLDPAAGLSIDGLTASVDTQDSLFYNASGLATLAFLGSGTAKITQTAWLDVNLHNIEQVDSAGTVHLVCQAGPDDLNDGEADTFLLRRDAATHTWVETLTNGQPQPRVPLAKVDRIDIRGSSDDDTLIVDLAGGMPIPACGLAFHGAEQTTADSLIVEHGHVTTLIGTFLTAHDGQLVLDGATITYTGLEPVRINVDSLSDALFHLPAASGDMVAMEDDDTSDNGLSRLRSLSASPMFATTTFTNPAHALTLNAAGGDTLHLTSLDRLFPATTTVTLLGDEHLDRLDIEDKDALARNLTFAYATPTSDSLAIDGYAFPIRLTSFDTIQYTGNATNDDRVTVQTTAAADAITVTPTGQNAADVLLNGGLAAGQPGPDLRFAGLDPAAGLSIDGLAPSVDTQDSLFYNVSGLATLAFLGSGTAKITQTAWLDVNLQNIEQVDAAGTVHLLCQAGPDDLNDDEADTFLLRRDGASHTWVELLINNQPQPRVPLAKVDRIDVRGSSDDDLLTVDAENGLITTLPGGAIYFDGAYHADPNDMPTSNHDVLQLTGDPRTAIARETYANGSAANALWGLDVDADTSVFIFDPDGLSGVGCQLPPNGDEQTVWLQTLTSVIDTTPTAELDLFFSQDDDVVYLENGPAADGLTTAQVHDGSATLFEPIAFAKKASVTMSGLLGADHFVVNHSTPATGLTSLQLHGHVRLDGPSLTDPGDADRFDLHALGPGITLSLAGQGGNDVFRLGGAGDTDGIQSRVIIQGNDGNDVLDIDDHFSGGNSKTVTLTATTIDGITAYAGLDADVTYSSLGAGTVSLHGNNTGHTYYVQSTAPGLTGTILHTGDGDDTIWIDDGNGRANGIASRIELHAQNSSVAGDTLIINDANDTNPNTFHLAGGAIGGGLFGQAVAPGGIFGTGGILQHDGNLENLLVYGASGSDSHNSYYIDDTKLGIASGTGRLDIHDGEGNAVFNVQANQLSLSTDHLFDGHGGNDAFHLLLPAEGTVAGKSVRIVGGEPAADSNHRDTVHLIVNQGSQPRNTTFTYLSPGEVEVQVDTGTRLELDAVETVNYLGDTADNDQVRVVGSANDDRLTVAPLSASRALVFCNTPAGTDRQGDLDNDETLLPGVAGGSIGPDLVLHGLDPSGIHVSGGGRGIGDTLTVYAPSEQPLLDPATTIDPFGFGIGQLLPGFGSGNAYDQIVVDDGQVVINNPFVGSLVPVLIDTASFVPADPQDIALAIHAGFEASADANGRADTISVTASSHFGIQILGNDPAETSPGDALILDATDCTFVFEADSETGVSTLGVEGRHPVYFDQIESLCVRNPGTVLVVGTPAEDDIRIIARDRSTHANADGVGDFTLSVNRGPEILMVDAPLLYVDALAGDDNILIRSSAPGQADWNVTAHVAGGTASDQDRFLLETLGDDHLVDYAPAGYLPPAVFAHTTADTGQITLHGRSGLSSNSRINLGPFFIAELRDGWMSSAGGVEHLVYDGQNGQDHLQVLLDETTADVVTYAFDPATGQGSVQVTADGSPRLAIRFQNVPLGQVSITDLGIATSDTLIYLGTPDDDSIRASGNTILNNVLDDVPAIHVAGIEQLQLHGLAGDDLFTVDDTHPFDGIIVAGGDSAENDVLQLCGEAHSRSVTLDLRVQQITGFGNSGTETVDFQDIDRVLLDGLGNDQLTVLHTSADDRIVYTPTGSQAGTFWQENGTTVYAFERLLGTFEIRGGTANADELVVIATGSDDVITIDARANNRTVTVEPTAAAPLKPVQLAAGVEVVSVHGREGNDTFLVIPGAPVGSSTAGQWPSNLRIRIDGGSTGEGNTLVIAGDPSGARLAASDFVVVNRSPTAGEGTVRVFRCAEPLPGVSYLGIDTVLPSPSLNGSGDPNLLILEPDLYEPNDSIATAADLGSGDLITVTDLSIVPGGDEPGFVVADEDYFRVVAQQTGLIDFEVHFHGYDPGLLPDGGNLDIRVLDVNGVEIAGNGSFGTNEADPLDADERVRIPAIAGQTYYLHVRGLGDGQSLVTNGYNITMINTAPPVPFDLQLESTTPNLGSGDPISSDNTPTLVLRLNDALFLDELLQPQFDEVIQIPFVGTLLTPGYRIAIFDASTPSGESGPPTAILLGYASTTGEPGLYTFTVPEALADGSHRFTARVEMIDPTGMIGLGESSAALEVTIDTQQPRASLGLPTVANDGLHADSDTGVAGHAATFADRITSNSTPTFWGTAEAGATLRLYIDRNANGLLDLATDLYLGQTIATPATGEDAASDAHWQFTSPIDLNDPAYFALDGLRTVFVTAEDPVGNVSQPENADALSLFLDTHGPRVASVTDSVTGQSIFDATSHMGPTPLASSIDITFVDELARTAEFDHAAVNLLLATTPGNYQLVGDANGPMLIDRIEVVCDGDHTVSGETIRMTTVRLVFAAPLPDDRFTLTVFDRIADDADNRLDGESPTIEPGQSFSGRFTVDSRPELAVWDAGCVWIDANGNFTFDSQPLDPTNSDITCLFGLIGDTIFAGNFSHAADDMADGFDKLAAYGYVDNQFRWLIDTNNDGLADIDQIDPATINGLPIAGRFDTSSANGDEVGLMVSSPTEAGSTWYFDTDHDFQVNSEKALASQLQGLPVVGDFNGDGLDDLGAWQDGLFQIDLAGPIGANGLPWDGQADVAFHFSFTGAQERPVAADMNQDGFEDLGLWAPDGDGQTTAESGMWRYLMSGPLAAGGSAVSILDRPDVESGTAQFQASPSGNDLRAEFGESSAIPLVGNFALPVTSLPRFLRLEGTSGNDLFEFVVGPTPHSCIVRVNGVPQTVDPSVMAISFDGLGGDDTITITGTEADESVEFWPDHLLFTSTDYTLQAKNIESTLIDGQAGTDTALLHDSPGDDNFSACAMWWATLKTAVTFLQLNNFDEIQAHATAGGVDVAWLYDSPGDDTLDAGPNSSTLSGTGFRHNAIGFEQVHAIARAGGNDTANLADSTGNERLVGWTGETRLYGSTFYLRAQGFDQALVKAAGGYDTAELYDSPGDDIFQAAAHWWATVKTGKSFLQVNGFDQVQAYATAGGVDTAWLYDSPGNDTFQAGPESSTLAGTGFRLETHSFEQIHAIARAGGNDTANLADSSGDEQLVGWTGETRLYGSTFYLRAQGFDNTHVTASGGTDTAQLYDSPGNDTFSACAMWWASLKTTNTFLQINNFDQVQAHATASGNDIAWLYDSPGNDTFQAGPESSTLSGTGYRLDAFGFEQVHALARSGGIDTATFADSAGAERLLNWTTETRLYSRTFYLRAHGFDNVYARATGGHDTAELHGGAGGDLFTSTGTLASWKGTGYSLEMTDFDELEIRAGGNTNDRAELTDASLQADSLPDAITRNYLAWLTEFDEIQVKRPSLPSEEILSAKDKIFAAWWE